MAFFFNYGSQEERHIKKTFQCCREQGSLIFLTFFQCKLLFVLHWGEVDEKALLETPTGIHQQGTHCFSWRPSEPEACSGSCRQPLAAPCSWGASSHPGDTGWGRAAGEQVPHCHPHLPPTSWADTRLPVKAHPRSHE